MVASFKSYELTAAQLIRIFIQTHKDGRWNLNARTKKEVFSTEYVMPS